ncbi:MAG: xanthine dehydrogenase family protein molybdopterin-binding subunit [Saprospiraceae bacterium]|nr:xanthine dehydrogenase family protein molybdopterin-binding subunit [Saprospiraceae bacterium]
MEKSSNNISRRNFIAAAGGVTLAITAYALYPTLSGSKKEIDPSDLAEEKVNAWVHLRNDGQITIYNPAAEMGQGSMTALPVILAEELDADWDKVKIETAPINVETYGFKAFGNRKVMINVGSRTVMGYYDALRQAGAQARYILLHSVAQHWSVPIQELNTAPSLVQHEASGREISYGEIVDILQEPENIPEIPSSDLKSPDEFRLIGKVLPRYDVPAKVDGSAQFAIDIQVPDMHYGVLERGKVHGAKPSLTNAAEIQSLEGIIAIVPFSYGVGVVATTLEKALAAKAKLAIDWDRNVTAQGHDSQSDLEGYQQLADASSDGKVMHKVGDVKAAMRKGIKKYTATYKNDYIYHAQMEPLNAIASVAADGQSAEIWAGTQNPGSIAPTVAKELGIEADQVKLNLCYLGGGLGRRSTSDYIVESVKLSQATGKPVKLMWTREDDLQYGMYRPLSLQKLEAATDANGQIIALNHCIVGDGSNLLASGAKNAFYNIPNQAVDLRLTQKGIRIKHWRAVGHGPNKFAIESFIDEIAADQGKDPLDIRRALMKDSPKALATLEKAAEMANWNTPPAPGRARGIAFGERSGALCTGICEISVEEDSGKIRVHHFWSAVDAGTIVQPDNVVAQMEGGIIMGMSSVFCEQLTIKNGEIQQSNFHDYPILRIEDAPESIEIAMMPSTDSPKGIGEASTPIVAGAIANAFATLTGKRLRHLPFSPSRVKRVLEA